MQAFFYLLQRDVAFGNGFIWSVDKKIMIREASPQKKLKM
jgi:hypothetical protein